MSSNPVAGNLFIVSAPSGAGKSSLVNALLEQDAQIALSVSTTTRPPRPGETPGEQYHFVSLEEFNASKANGEFLEYAQVFDHWYGTRKSAIETLLAAGKDVVLEIDWQGARQIKQRFRQSRGIFILPPSLPSLRQRLSQRGQDSETVIERRMRDARREISHWHEFDYLIVNDDFATALADLHCIVRASRLAIASQNHRLAGLLAELLKNS